MEDEAADPPAGGLWELYAGQQSRCGRARRGTEAVKRRARGNGGQNGFLGAAQVAAEVAAQEPPGHVNFVRQLLANGWSPVIKRHRS